jgi:hypothetical protein
MVAAVLSVYLTLDITWPQGYLERITRLLVAPQVNGDVSCSTMRIWEVLKTADWMRL